MSLRFAPTAELIVQFCTFHTGKITDVKDEDGVMCVKCECNGLVSEGISVGWICLSTNPIGSGIGNGDEGLWWPAQVGQSVRIGFLAGNPFILYAFIGPPVSDKENNNQPLIPKEAVALWKTKDYRKPTRIRLLKGEAGHTLLMDDNGEQELCALLNWTGSGLAFWGQGKDKIGDEPREEDKRRGVSNVFDGSAKKPSEILKHGIEYVGLLDLMKGGLLTFASDDIGGVVIIQAKKKDGSLGPSLVLDGVNDRVYLSTSKGVQIQLLGDKDKIMTTRHMILEAEFEEMKGRVDAIEKELNTAFKPYKQG